MLVLLATYNEDISRNFQRLDMIGQYINLDFDQAVDDDQVVRRIGMISATKDMIIENPFLGVGLGKENYFNSFPLYYLSYFHIGRPHNQYLALAATTGIVGLLSFLVFLYSIMMHGIRSLQGLKKDHDKYMLGQFILISNFLILVLMVGYEFETEPFIWMIWALTSGYFTLVKAETRTRSRIK